jgi:hypothetical protein
MSGVAMNAPTLGETDEVLAELAAMPWCPETAEVIDAVLDYRLRLRDIAAGAAGHPSDARSGAGLPSQRRDHHV